MSVVRFEGVRIVHGEGAVMRAMLGCRWVVCALVVAVSGACSQERDGASREAADVRPAVAPGAGIDPWVHGQPDTPLCPVCPVRGGRFSGGSCTATFAGTLSSSYPSYPVSGITVKLYNGSTLVHTETGIAPSVGYANDTVNHTFTPSSCTYDAATLSWTNPAGPDSQSVSVL